MGGLGPVLPVLLGSEFQFSMCPGAVYRPGRFSSFWEDCQGSVEKLTLGSSAVKGTAEPLLIEFLQKQSGGNVEREPIPSAAGGRAHQSAVKGRRLKSLTFAESTYLSRYGTDWIFKHLPDGLEALSLEGNACGCNVEELVERGQLSYLKELNLRRSGLNTEEMRKISKAFSAASPLRIESLSLGGNNFCLGLPWDTDTVTFSPCLRNATLPFLRELEMDGCRLAGALFRQVVAGLDGGELPMLETLSLKNVRVTENRLDGVMKEFSSALRASAVPRLKFLNMRGFRAAYESYIGGEGADALIAALTAEGRPSLERMCPSITLRSVKEETARVVGSGEIRFLRSLDVRLCGKPALAFFGGLAKAPRAPEWENLDLMLYAAREGNAEMLSAFAESLRLGRLGCLESVVFRKQVGLEHCSFREPGGEEEGGERESPLFRALGDVKLPLLSQLVLDDFGLQEPDVVCLGEGVRGGNFPQLGDLRLSRGNFGRAGMEALCGGDGQQDGGSGEGLGSVWDLDFSHTRAGEGIRALCKRLLGSGLKGLVNLRLVGVGLDDDGMEALGVAVLSQVKVLDLSQNEFGRAGTRGFFQLLQVTDPESDSDGVNESGARGGGGQLACLEILLLSFTNAGEGAASSLAAGLGGKRLPYTVRLGVTKVRWLLGGR
uniref:Uncharacterized protein n=1 Tax=Chromera velia CCMP2878 TaxID=1169474 RepID=A0A0G4FDC1_9ALVE|eukprot:Cvel_3227.t1-p1 / transcript=Cvel_3227.t1 / gene=Cvel_3227 / organism=Chromera_velia_CCMP2878 / gene_product=hypothetical protein / transcript_product=hypothetical protein / location=Cvel_scaffold126:67496-69478(-) / protein_length=661 / sequence_SO=supercontig / SO=protein_coding / is_pseudo=false